MGLEREILFCVIPLFVAIDIFGLLPIYVSMTESFSPAQKRKVERDSLLTALGISVGFILLGRAIFRFLGITVADFEIAGGIVLAVLGILDLLAEEKRRRLPDTTMGIVPLGTPLLVGPAVLSVSLLLLNRYGILPTLIALLLNLLVVAQAFRFANFLMKYLGRGGTRALSKIVTILLVAIAVRMIRSGLQELYGAAHP